MLLIPAIDLKDGRCVRLKQGRMEDSTIFGDDPVAIADRWVKAGTKRLHLVDLNGAFAGHPVNGEVIRSIVEKHPTLPMQVGGGIRDLATIQAYIDMGVQYTILGTKAVRQPEFVAEACQAFPGHIMVSLDARDGQVAVEGWSELLNQTAIDLAHRFETDGVTAIVYTDINRDGMMSGVNVEATAQLAREIKIPVIASGGITNIDDLNALGKVAGDGILGAITGRAIYEGSLDFAAGLRLAASF